jgi:signal transduction histidine kinase
MSPFSPAAQAAVPGTGGLLRRLAASLAHNVNNALTGVIGYLELAQRQTPPETEVHHHLEASLTCAYQAAEAVKRIVTFACRDPGTETLQTLSLRALVERAAENLARPADPRIAVEVEGPAVWVRGSEVLLLPALEQVLNNALEAMTAGGTLQLHLEESQGQGFLHVRDTGCGMSEEVQAHLFEPFLTTKPSGHLGLGLTLCREMVQAQGGRVSVRSVPGVGTEVTLSFPLLAATPSRLVEPPPEPPPDERPAPRHDDRQSASAPHWASPARALNLAV